jgi:hypothetical protein
MERSRANQSGIDFFALAQQALVTVWRNVVAEQLYVEITVVAAV